MLGRRANVADFVNRRVAKVDTEAQFFREAFERTRRIASAIAVSGAEGDPVTPPDGAPSFDMVMNNSPGLPVLRRGPR